MSDLSVPETHLPLNLGKKMQSTAAIETKARDNQKLKHAPRKHCQGFSNRGSSLLSLVLGRGFFSQAIVSLELDIPAIGTRFWL